METITLREVALRLAKIERPGTAGIADGQLLSLLKSGELQAGFDFPGYSRRWVPIPMDYWLKIDSRQFRSIRRDEKCTFKVRLSDVVDSFLELVFDSTRPSLSTASLQDEFRSALTAASRRYEVVVQASKWKKYLERHQLAEPALRSPPMKGRGGRNPLPAWNRLAVIIPAYLLAYHDKQRDKPKYEEAAHEIYNIAKDKEVPAIPAADTLKDVISEIYRIKENIFKQ
jgi:hypothetical protein